MIKKSPDRVGTSAKPDSKNELKEVRTAGNQYPRKSLNFGYESKTAAVTFRQKPDDPPPKPKP